ncbi:hypothetical protein [Pedobacter sp.]
MIASKILTQHFIYINLHAEEVISSTFIEDNNIGIYTERLHINTLQRIKDALSLEQIKNLILDFKHIKGVQPNLNKLLFELKNNGFKILFINLGCKLADDLYVRAISNFDNVEAGEQFDKFFFFENEPENPLVSVKLDIQELFEDEFKTRLKNYIIPDYDQPHNSSFVYLKSFVDIRKFFALDKGFILFSLYRLALRMRRKFQLEKESEQVLVCQSLNSAYIISVLSNLLSLDILIIDKNGPKNKLYNRLDKSIEEDRSYIIVSELVCLGTEVKSAKNLIQFLGGKYMGNVAIIKVETLSNKHIKSKDATTAIFSIKRSNNVELNYNISTDLAN